jgi:transcriptional regulator with XRE-family HTH domain
MPKRSGVGHYNSRYGPVEFDGTPQSIKNEFARRLEKRRSELNMNQSEVAREASKHLPEPAKGKKQGRRIGRDQISHYSRGISLPRPETLRALAMALGCEPKDLMPKAAPSTAVPPSFRIVETGDGKGRLTLDRILPLTTIMKIYQLLVEEEAQH